MSTNSADNLMTNPNAEISHMWAERSAFRPPLFSDFSVRGRVRRWLAVAATVVFHMGALFLLGVSAKEGFVAPAILDTCGESAMEFTISPSLPSEAAPKQVAESQPVEVNHEDGFIPEDNVSERADYEFAKCLEVKPPRDNVASIQLSRSELKVREVETLVWEKMTMPSVISERKPDFDAIKPRMDSDVGDGDNRTNTAASDGDMLTKGIDCQPALLSFPRIYPRGAKLRGEEGDVLCEVVVGDTGRVLSARVIESCGYDSLDRMAVYCLRHASAKVGRVDGKAVEMKLTAKYVFRLRDAE